jgi:prolyl-tRNA synthetase
MAQVQNISKKSEDISAWYQDVIREAKLAEHGPTRGSMIFRPYGYAIWESVQAKLDKRIKAMGVDNAYFPLFIPMSFFEKEKDHVEGFAPELAVVTHGGGEKLAEPMAVRPTSETIIYDAFSRWIQSFRDLPLKVNQWCSVVRWEKRPNLFLRSTEFLWQEGHTAHQTEEEAIEQVNDALKAYIETYQKDMALFGYAGRKSETEKFAGAKSTLTYE